MSFYGGSPPSRGASHSMIFPQSPSAAFKALSGAGPTEAERKLATIKPVNGRIDISGQNLGSIDGLLPSTKVEALYARSNGLRTIAGLPALPQLRVLDVSSNLLTDIFIPKCSLRMLFLSANNISDITVVPSIATLEVLSLSSNRLTSLDGMQPQPELKVLSVSSNQLTSFSGMPMFPKLESFRAADNPVARSSSYKQMAISVCSANLTRLDGEPVDQVASDLPLRACYAIRRGLVLQQREDADAEAQAFLHTVIATTLSPCSVHDAVIGGEPVEGNTLVAQLNIVGPDGRELVTTGEFLESEAAAAAGGIMRLQWYRAARGCEFEPIPKQTGLGYTASLNDVGCALMLSVSVELDDGRSFGPSPIVTADIVPAPPQLRALSLDGRPLEGTQLTVCADYVGGREGDSSIKWFAIKEDTQEQVLVAEETRQLTLGLAHIGCEIMVEYTPVREDGAVGPAQTAKCAVVQAARPSVSDVAIGGVLMEGSVVYGTGRYFGGAEGASVFQWYRGDQAAGPFVPIPGARAQSYTPLLADVGRVLRFEYTPISTRGIVGTPAVVVSTPIIPAPPTVRRLQIVGDTEELQMLTLVVDYFGGVEGRSDIQWSRKSALPSATLEQWQDIPGATAPRYTLSTDDIMHYVRCVYRPVRSDTVHGAPVMATTEQPVRPCLPTVQELCVAGTLLQGEKLRVEGRYNGGVEGASRIVWERMLDDITAEQACASERHYTPTVADVGRRLRVTYVPVRNDGVEGLPSSVLSDPIQPAAPRVMKLELEGDCLQGATLRVRKEYYGGREGASRYRWLRVRALPDGSSTTTEDVGGAASSDYALAAADVGCVLVLEYIPVREDGVAGNVAVVRTTRPIAPAPPAALNVTLAGSHIEGSVLAVAYDYYGGAEGATQIIWFRMSTGGAVSECGRGRTYTTTVTDIGSVMAASVTPVRVDGVAGTSVSVQLPQSVVAAEPQVLGFALSAMAQEEVTIKVQGRYFGGNAGTQHMSWFRVNPRNPSAAGELVSTERDYTPQLGDVGSVLRFEWVPERADGARGEKIVAETNTVQPGAPVLVVPPTDPTRQRTRAAGAARAAAEGSSSYEIMRLSNGDLVLNAEFRGGYEGSSRIVWQRIGVEGATRDIPGATGKMYTPVPTDTGFSIGAKYQPVRSDGVAGETYVFEPTVPLLFSDVFAIKELSIDGKPAEGENVTARVSGYDGRVLFKWSRQPPGGGSFNAIDGATAPNYTPVLDDVGCVLQVEATPMFGDTLGRPSTAVTAPIAPGFPELRTPQMLVRGDRSHASQFTITGKYFGGREGASVVSWCRSRKGQPYEVIPGVTGKVYQGNADDIDAIIKVEYRPLRSDGVAGAPVGKEIGPLLMSPEVSRELTVRLAAREATFTVQLTHRVEDGIVLAAPEPRSLTLSKDKIKLRVVNTVKTLLKEFYNTHTSVFINPTSPNEFAIVLSPSVTLHLLAATPQERDLVALIIRSYTQTASTGRNFKKALTFKQAALAVRAAQAWAQPAKSTGVMPSSRVMALALKEVGRPMSQALQSAGSQGSGVGTPVEPSSPVSPPRMTVPVPPGSPAGAGVGKS